MAIQNLHKSFENEIGFLEVNIKTNSIKSVVQSSNSFLLVNTEHDGWVHGLVHDCDEEVYWIGKNRIWYNDTIQILRVIFK